MFFVVGFGDGFSDALVAFGSHDTGRMENRGVEGWLK